MSEDAPRDRLAETGKSIEAFAELEERIEAEGRNTLFTLSNGIVIRCKPIPPLYLEALREQFIPNPPPTVKIGEGDDAREEENPNDPAYLRYLQQNTLDEERAVFDTILAMGTECASVPDNVFGPDDDGWIEWCREYEEWTSKKVPINIDSPKRRYVSWLRFYALVDSNDGMLIGSIPQLIAGLREDTVAQAIAAFRRASKRGADNAGARQPASPNGNRAQKRAARTRK